MTMMRTMKCVSEQPSPIHHPRSWSREGLGSDAQFAQSEVPSHLLPVMSQPVSHVPPVMLQVALAKSYNKKYEKRIALTKMPKTVFKKIIVVTEGAVPIPILLEVKVLPMVRLTLESNTKGSGYIKFALSKEAEVSLDSLSVSYDHGLLRSVKLQIAARDLNGKTAQLAKPISMLVLLEGNE